ncbi:hypothetical protein P7C70_g3944, partial [Phenoliferia sp. Uapishka_3]
MSGVTMPWVSYYPVGATYNTSSGATTPSRWQRATSAPAPAYNSTPDQGAWGYRYTQSPLPSPFTEPAPLQAHDYASLCEVSPASGLASPPTSPVTASGNIPSGSTSYSRPPLPSALTPSSHAKKKPAGHVPRPPNAWILYRSQSIQKLKEDPAFEKMRQPDISKIVGRLWREETDEVKQWYQHKAECKKAEHKNMYPEYRFLPRARKIRSAIVDKKPQSGTRHVQAKPEATIDARLAEPATYSQPIPLTPVVAAQMPSVLLAFPPAHHVQSALNHFAFPPPRNIAPRVPTKDDGRGWVIENFRTLSD